MEVTCRRLRTFMSWLISPERASAPVCLWPPWNALLPGIPKVFCKAITPGMVIAINKLPSELKERLEYKVDLCGVEAWEMREHRREKIRTMPDLAKQVVKTYPAQGEMQLFRLAGATEFNCSRCQTTKTAKLVAVVSGIGTGCCATGAMGS